MAEYINKEQFLAHLFSKQDEPLDVMKEIAEFPAAGVVEVKHGRWIPDITGQLFCSECKQYGVPNCVTKYCPNCGARMDKEN